MRVLITGAGGFIGSHLVADQLKRGREVTAVDLRVDSLQPLASNPRLCLRQVDFADAALLNAGLPGHDVCFHLASAHLDVRQADAHYRRVNVQATVELLEAAHRAGVKRVVHCSSVGVMGTLQELPADERTPCRPTHIYEQTKLEGEQEALRLAARTGLPVVVARPAWVYGPRCPRTAKLFRTAGRGRFVIFGNGRTLRQPIYVSDLVRGLERCATHGDPGQVYIIAGAQVVTVEELVRSVAAVLGVRLRAIHLPLWFGRLAGLGLEALFKPLGKQPPFSRRSFDFFSKHNAYRIDKAERELGFRPQVDLCSGLKEAAAWLEVGSAGLDGR
jgi:nucleoside-diphosphate-sugar epimerase